MSWEAYAAQWSNTQLSQVDALFERCASEKGVRSEECVTIVGIFSRFVDQEAADVNVRGRAQTQTTATIL